MYLINKYIGILFRVPDLVTISKLSFVVSNRQEVIDVTFANQGIDDSIKNWHWHFRNPRKVEWLKYEAIVDSSLLSQCVTLT